MTLPSRGRWTLAALAEITALCGLAIAQPVLDITGRAPEFFLFYRASTVQMLAWSWRCARCRP